MSYAGEILAAATPLLIAAGGGVGWWLRRRDMARVRQLEAERETDHDEREAQEADRAWLAGHVGRLERRVASFDAELDELRRSYAASVEREIQQGVRLREFAIREQLLLEHIARLLLAVEVLQRHAQAAAEADRAGGPLPAMPDVSALIRPPRGLHPSTPLTTEDPT